MLTPEEMAAERRRILGMLGEACAICGEEGADTLDHVAPMFDRPREAGGNVRVVHDACMGRASSRAWQTEHSSCNSSTSTSTVSSTRDAPSNASAPDGTTTGTPSGPNTP